MLIMVYRNWLSKIWLDKKNLKNWLDFYFFYVLQMGEGNWASKIGFNLFYNLKILLLKYVSNSHSNINAIMSKFDMQKIGLFD